MENLTFALVGRAILPSGEEPDGAVIVRGDTIVYAGERSGALLPEAPYSLRMAVKGLRRIALRAGYRPEIMATSTEKPRAPTAR